MRKAQKVRLYRWTFVWKHSGMPVEDDVYVIDRKERYRQTLAELERKLKSMLRLEYNRDLIEIGHVYGFEGYAATYNCKEGK